MAVLHIDFFHDVLCAWCYALSPRLRRLSHEYPEIVIDHHCFALAPSPEGLEEMFGDKTRAKEEILKHWRAANENDDGHRINSALMAERSHDYPYSMPGLIGCKAAEILKGNDGHWDYFDRVQKAHLTECLDITKRETLVMCALDIGLDVARFEALLDDPMTLKAVQKDLQLAQKLGIDSVPTLIIDSTVKISGAYHYEYLKGMIEREIRRIH
ncbi:MAG TPA: DsbA family protein [Spirochaetia bacterium]|jgi:predicted DsbA family dithiol-disulfide isomerase|nr:DsbA family protein [Spirochaetia bacterium]